MVKMLGRLWHVFGLWYCGYGMGRSNEDPGYYPSGLRLLLSVRSHGPCRGTALDFDPHASRPFLPAWPYQP